MSTDTATTFVDLIDTLAQALNPYRWNERSHDGYLIALVDLDLEMVQRAVVEALQTCDKMPPPAELRRIALRQSGANPPSVEEAWAEVQSAIGRYGYTRAPEFTHPLIATAVQRIGWRNLCASTDRTGDRIAFRGTYSSLLERTEREALTSPALTARFGLIGRTMAELDAGEP